MNELSQKAENLTKELYDEIYKVVDNKPNKFIRLHSQIYAYEYVLDILNERQIVSISILNGELCIITKDPEDDLELNYDLMTDDEILEWYEWKTILGGNFNKLQTLLEINGIIDYYK